MNSNKPEIEASEWLARLDKDDVSSEEVAEFTRWKTADPRHAGAHARLAATWQALERIQVLRPPAAEAVDKDYLADPGKVCYQDSSQRHIKRLSRLASARLPRILSAPIHTQLLVVGVAALLVALTGFWNYYRPGGVRSFSTSVGGFQRVVLADQSVMDLNTDSEVRVALTPHTRKIELVRGEASFEVTHDASRPFIVSTDSLAVRAVGTKFDVRRFRGSTEVTVAEGKVVIGSPGLLDAPQISASPSLLHVSAGQTAMSSGGGVNLQTLPKGGIARKLAWQNQMLVFDSDTLAEVVAQFNRYNDRQMAIVDPNLATVHISGYFRPTNLDAFLSVLQSNFGIRVNNMGDRLTLSADTTQ